MDLKSIWSVLEESSGILFGSYANPAAGKAAQELTLPPDYFPWVSAIWLFDTNPFTVAQYMRCFPYGLARANDERLTSAVQQGYLASESQGSYRATESGRAAAARLMQEGNDLLAALTPLPKESLRRLGNLLSGISNAVLTSPEPPAHVLIKAKRALYQRANVFPTLEGVVANTLQLEGNRDDCYIATWGAHGFEGHVWDMLDFLSQNDALIFDELQDKLSRKGVTREVRAVDMKELVGRGWAEDSSGVIKATEAGKQIRVEVEAETERQFFTPWSCLTGSKLDKLASLASELRDGLKKMAA